jgi:hypothetical protein
MVSHPLNAVLSLDVFADARWTTVHEATSQESITHQVQVCYSVKNAPKDVLDCCIYTTVV